jgi:hypothetical protein
LPGCCRRLRSLPLERCSLIWRTCCPPSSRASGRGCNPGTARVTCKRYASKPPGAVAIRRALVTNTTPCQNPGQVAQPGSPGGSDGYSSRSYECSRCYRRRLLASLLRSPHQDRPKTHSRTVSPAHGEKVTSPQRAPTEGSLVAAWTDQQPPQHVHHERYDDKDEEYSLLLPSHTQLREGIVLRSPLHVC